MRDIGRTLRSIVLRGFLTFDNTSIQDKSVGLQGSVGEPQRKTLDGGKRSRRYVKNTFFMGYVARIPAGLCKIPFGGDSIHFVCHKLCISVVYCIGRTLARRKKRTTKDITRLWSIHDDIGPTEGAAPASFVFLGTLRRNTLTYSHRLGKISGPGGRCEFVT